MTNNTENRISRVRERFAGLGVDGLLITKQENQAYVTGFSSDDLFVILTEKEQYIMTDSRYTETVADHCPDFRLVESKKDYGLSDFLAELALPVLGYEQEAMTVGEYRRLADKLGEKHLSGTSGLVESVRIIKDEREIETIGRAAALGDRCFSHMLSWFREGVTEREAALEIEMFFKSNGASRLSFDTICIFGPHTSLPHGVPGETPLKKGDLITMDFGCVVDDYCSDMTRTIAFGSATEEQKEVYQIVLEAQLAGVNGLKAGMTCREGDRLCRDVIEAAGYGAYFGHGTGHGVGLEIHEAPTLGPRSDETLQENMTVTIEPGIYLPKKFGVRIEDLAIVTSFGIMNKVCSAKELIIL